MYRLPRLSFDLSKPCAYDDKLIYRKGGSTIKQKKNKINQVKYSLAIVKNRKPTKKPRGL